MSQESCSPGLGMPCPFPSSLRAFFPVLEVHVLLCFEVLQGNGGRRKELEMKKGTSGL